MKLPLFIANRIYYGEGSKEKVSRPAIRIAMLGVAIGLAIMIVSVCVVIGFKHTIRDKVIGFGSHIEVANFLTLESEDNHPIVMDDYEFTKLKRLSGIKHVQRFANKQGILKTDHEFLGVILQGVAQEYDTTFLHNAMVEGSIPKFNDKVSHNKLLISKYMADALNLHTGNKIFAYFIEKNGVRMRRFSISGVYETNLNQYDRAMCFTDLYTTVKLNGWNTDQATGAELVVNDFDKLDEIDKTVVDNINKSIDKNGETYSSKTIKEINPQIFSWLSLLDMNVWIILALMMVVASVTMISGLLIIILERTTMIGILKALGARNKVIRHTFLWFSVFIIGKGLLWGNFIGIGICLLQKFTGIITLDPQTYYVSTVPIEFNFPFIIIINLATLIISILVLIIPSFLISHIHPAKSMRYE